MATVFKLNAQERDINLKPNQLRKKGLIPAVIYGPAMKTNRHITINSNELKKMIEKVSETTLIELNVEKQDGSEKITGFVKTVQRHKVSDQLIHVDFYVPEEGRKMNIRIPVEYVGEPEGVTAGGFLNVYIHELPVEILPSEIVDSIELDISTLKLGESLTVQDIKPLLPKSADVLLEEEETLVSVIEPKEVQEEAQEEEEITEPEVIEEKTPKDLKEE